MDTTCMRRYEIIPSMFDFELPHLGKPMNTKTRKTAWKERRRRANLPRSMQKRLART